MLSERVLDATRRHARDLVPAVADLLRQQAWRPHDLGGVAVSAGPGSYTGLRVGIISAKTLAFALGCKVIAVPTFHVIARRANVTENELDVVADAQQDNLYVQRFGRQDAAEQVQRQINWRWSVEGNGREPGRPRFRSRGLGCKPRRGCRQKRRR